MSLSKGRIYRATPGPSIIPDKVLQAMHRPAPDIYEGEIIDATESVLKDLANFAKTSGEVVMYVSNGHGAWEAAIANLFNRGDTVIVLATGQFGLGWADLCTKMNLNVILLDSGFEKTVDLQILKETLTKDKHQRIKAVLCAQTDTASSILNDIKSISEIIDQSNHSALLLIDSIACFGCDRLEMDEWGVDLMVTACQKGLMTPPGLAYCFIGRKALKLAQNKKCISPYWDWKPRINPKVFYERFYGTAPTHHIFAQRAALNIMLEEGREKIFERHRILATAIWIALKTWNKKKIIGHNIREPEYRSCAVTTIRANGYNLDTLRVWLKRNMGLELGIGLGFSERKYLNGKSICRLAHMGHINPVMILGALSSIESGLIACNIPHGSGGASAANKFIAKNIF